MKSIFQFIIIIAAFTSIAQGQEWYMPDSHLINEAQFQELVLNDKSTFKIVKYFSPGCGFCRYLKQVVDQLKHQKQWCFKIYDFNCQWYPQHCMNNVRSPSFPYTAIHNGDGALHEQIHGFYPLPVIKQIFDRIQLLCLSLRNPPKQLENTQQNLNSLSTQNELKKTQLQPSLQTPPSAEAQPFQSIPKQVEAIDIKQQPTQKGKQEIQGIASDLNKESNYQARISVQQEIKIDKISEPSSNQPQISTVPHINPNSEQGNYIKYFIYGLTIVISILYFHHINKGKQVVSLNHINNPQAQQTTPLMEKNNQISSQQHHVQQILRKQSELLASIPDQQL